VTVFDVFCTTCAHRRLIFPGQVLALTNDGAGIHVAYRCWCGALGQWDTGRSAVREAARIVRQADRGEPVAA
jgi:hypothetical protein